jgi:hypothetical protein
MRAILFVVSIALALSACDEFRPMRREPDQAKRALIFQECLKAVPEGPRVTHTSDWSQVVKACDSAAYYQSMVCVENCRNDPAHRAEP